MATTKLVVSLYQMNVQLAQVAMNLDKVREIVKEASRRESTLLILPELWSTGFPLEKTLPYAERSDGPVLSEISRLARSYKICILGSTLIKKGDDVTNCATLYNAEGLCIAEYEKLHLFTLMNEDRYLKAGEHRTTLSVSGWVSSLAICYDLRFPELFRRYALEQSRMVLIPAAWPAARVAHWRVLLQARAIENGFFVVGCNQTGITGKTRFGGFSGVIDPLGQVCLEGTEVEELLTTEIDSTLVQQARKRLPVLKDRRPELYE